jgi:hypothetical protein
MRFPDSPAVQDNSVATLIGRIARTLDGAGEVDSRHHRELAHDRNCTRDGERILVVDGRILNANGDIPRGQSRFIEVF